MNIKRIFKILTDRDADHFSKNHPSLIKYFRIIKNIEIFLGYIKHELNMVYISERVLKGLRTDIIDEVLFLEKEVVRFRPTFSRDWHKERKYRIKNFLWVFLKEIAKEINKIY